MAYKAPVPLPDKLKPEQKAALRAGYRGRTTKDQDILIGRLARKYGTVPLWGWGRELCEAAEK